MHTTDDDFASEHRRRLIDTLHPDGRRREPGAVVIYVLMVVAGVVFVGVAIATVVVADPVANAKRVPVEVLPCR